MNKNRLPRIFFVGLLWLLTACQSAGQPLSTAMLKPGDTIDNMGLTTGGRDAVPLWAFCSPVQHLGNTTTSVCSVPLIPRLAIGHISMPRDAALYRLDWSEIHWELSIDGQPIDLLSFGTYDFVLPAMSQNASPVREVFVKYQAWDVVLTNLSPGEHTIQSSAQVGAESHDWVTHLTIEVTDVDSGRSWAGPENQ